MKIPKSIPKKFHKYITDIGKEDGLEIADGGVGWVCNTKGLSTHDGAHCAFERTLKDIKGALENMTVCDQDCECHKWDEK